MAEQPQIEGVELLDQPGMWPSISLDLQVSAPGHGSPTFKRIVVTADVKAFRDQAHLESVVRALLRAVGEKA